MKPGELPVMVGTVLEVAEGDYKYGAGPLLLRVTAVGQVFYLADGPWLGLMGVELRADGSPLVPIPRPVSVRMSALPPRSWAPGRTT